MSAEIDLRGMGKLLLYEPPPFRVLCVEDDVGAARTTVEGLTDRGIGYVDVANTAKEASALLARSQYDAVLADVVLDDAPQVRGNEKQGDEWVLEHLAEMGGAKCTIVTGRRARIANPDRLKNNGVRIVIKGPDELLLYDELGAAAKAKTALVADRVASVLEEALHVTPLATASIDPIGDAVIEEASAVFERWVNSLAGADTRQLWLEGRAISPREVAQEVAARSKLGRRILRLFMHQMAVTAGLASEDDE